MSKKLAPVGQGAGTFQGVAVQTAGALTPASSNRRAPALTDEQRDAMVHMYTADRLPIREISRKVGRSYGTVHRVLTEANVTMRGRNGR